MVFFTCNHCGESLKKQSVEKHYKWQKCKGAPVFVTCVDCLKDFREQEYVGHTKCITEAERYYGKDYQAKPSQNKGQKKQEAWTDIIQSVLQRSDLSTRIQGVLKTLTMHENVPRKKPKFLNFMKNVSRQTSTYDATRIFELIEEAYQQARDTQKVDTPEGKESNGNVEPQDEVKNGDTENVPEENGNLETPKEKKKKKRKAEKNENGHEDLGTQEQVQQPQDEDKNVNGDAEKVPEENGNLETPKEKKKKKRKAEKNENGLEDKDTQEQVQEEDKPKKKRKKTVEEAKVDNVPCDVTDAVDVGKTSNNQEEEKQPSAVQEEEKMEEKIDETPKEKSKKKRKNQEDTEESAKVDESSEPKKKKKKKEMNGQVPEDKNEDTETKIPEEESFNKGKKRKEVIEQIKNDAKEDNFSWNNSIKEILQKSDNSITLEKLKKRLIKNYLKMHPDCVEISNKIDLIVNRRLRKMKKVSLDNGVVTLKA